MGEYTLGDAIDRYRAAEEVVQRHGLEIRTDVTPGADDWVRMVEAADTIMTLEAENASLQQRVEALERVHFWVKSYMISMKADMSSRLAAKDGLEQALAAAQEQGEG